MRRCVHGERFPCCQCLANRRWNEAATRRRLTEEEFEAEYADGVFPESAANARKAATERAEKN